MHDWQSRKEFVAWKAAVTCMRLTIFEMQQTGEVGTARNTEDDATVKIWERASVSQCACCGEGRGRLSKSQARIYTAVAQSDGRLRLGSSSDNTSVGPWTKAAKQHRGRKKN